MPSPADPADAYLAGAAALRAAVSGMTPDQLRARPVPGKWSTLEVVAHLADFELVLADRIRRVIALDNPTLLGADHDLFVKELFYQDRDITEELAVVDATRASTTRVIRHLSAEQLRRTGQHSERGPLTLERLIGMASNHIPHHLEFVAEKRAALGMS